METFWSILFIICLFVQIPVWIAYLFHDKELDEKIAEEMRKKYPDWPNVQYKKPHYTSFPLNLWNEPENPRK